MGYEDDALIRFGTHVIYLLVYGALFSRMARKAGYTGCLALGMFVPFFNIVLTLLFVFSEWPVEAQLKAYKEKFGSLPGEPIKCLACGALVKSEAEGCALCGWSYRDGPGGEVE